MPTTRARVPSTDTIRYEAWAIAAPGLETIVEAELHALGFVDAKAAAGGVTFVCDARGIARANLHLRAASRVIVRLAQFRAAAFHELERAARKVEWGRIIAPGTAVELRVTCRKSRLYHSDAVAQRVGDAIARSVSGARIVKGKARADDAPDAEDADDASATARMRQLIVVRLDHDRCTISADSSGELLHRRGYRQAVAKAPLRETLAAAMLLGVPWDPHRPLVDPMCGSGTIAIEAAMIARRIAPGRGRSFAAERWPEIDRSAFSVARDEARALELPGASAPILASDRDEGAIQAARANAERAGVPRDITFEVRPLSAIEPPAEGAKGVILSNPPYGIRVGETKPLRDLFARLGQVARERFEGWEVALLSADRTLEAQVRLAFEERFRTSNGGIPVRLIRARAEATAPARTRVGHRRR